MLNAGVIHAILLCRHMIRFQLWILDSFLVRVGCHALECSSVALVNSGQVALVDAEVPQCVRLNGLSKLTAWLRQYVFVDPLCRILRRELRVVTSLLLLITATEYNLRTIRGILPVRLSTNRTRRFLHTIPLIT